MEPGRHRPGAAGDADGQTRRDPGSPQQQGQHAVDDVAIPSTGLQDGSQPVPSPAREPRRSGGGRDGRVVGQPGRHQALRGRRPFGQRRRGQPVGVGLPGRRKPNSRWQSRGRRFPPLRPVVGGRQAAVGHGQPGRGPEENGRRARIGDRRHPPAADQQAGHVREVAGRNGQQKGAAVLRPQTDRQRRPGVRGHGGGQFPQDRFGAHETAVTPVLRGGEKAKQAGLRGGVDQAQRRRPRRAEDRARISMGVVGQAQRRHGGGSRRPGRIQPPQEQDFEQQQRQGQPRHQLPGGSEKGLPKPSPGGCPTLPPASGRTMGIEQHEVLPGPLGRPPQTAQLTVIDGSGAAHGDVEAVAVQQEDRGQDGGIAVSAPRLGETAVQFFERRPPPDGKAAGIEIHARHGGEGHGALQAPAAKGHLGPGGFQAQRPGDALPHDVHRKGRAGPVVATQKTEVAQRRRPHLGLELCRRGKVSGTRQRHPGAVARRQPAGTLPGLQVRVQGDRPAAGPAGRLDHQLLRGERQHRPEADAVAAGGESVAVLARRPQPEKEAAGVFPAHADSVVQEGDGLQAGLAPAGPDIDPPGPGVTAVLPQLADEKPGILAVEAAALLRPVAEISSAHRGLPGRASGLAHGTPLFPGSCRFGTGNRSFYHNGRPPLIDTPAALAVG